MSVVRACAALALTGALQSVVVAQDTVAQDEARVAWRYRREVRLSGGGVYAAVPVPPSSRPTRPLAWQTCAWSPRTGRRRRTSWTG
jgi:hypothetical protein